jgi:hypothetical protein
LTKRQTQLFALMLLVGAPLIVSLLSGYFLPGLHDVLPAPQLSGPPADMQPAPDPAASLPPAQPGPPPGQTVQNGPHAGGNYAPVAMLDTSGTAISGSDPTPLALAGSDPSTPSGTTPVNTELSGDKLRAMTEEQH